MLEKEIKEFQQVFQKEFGYKISSDEAIEYATRLIDLIKATYEQDSSESR